RRRRHTRWSVTGVQTCALPILLSITGGRLLVSNEFAKALGRPSHAGVVAGEISIGATMETIEINHLDENGNVKSASLPAVPLPEIGRASCRERRKHGGGPREQQ